MSGLWCDVLVHLSWFNEIEGSPKVNVVSVLLISADIAYRQTIKVESGPCFFKSHKVKY